MTQEIKVRVLQSLKELMERVQADDVTGVALFSCDVRDGRSRVAIAFGGEKDDIFIAAFERAKLSLLIPNYLPEE